MKKFTLLLSAMLFSVMSFGAEYTTTISFSNKAQRTVYTNEQQVWEQMVLLLPMTSQSQQPM
jgi:endoglucanase Acf2